LIPTDGEHVNCLSISLQVWPGTTAFPDFFHPGADEYWLQHAKAFHDLVPYDGLWIVSTQGCVSIVDYQITLQ